MRAIHKYKNNMNKEHMRRVAQSFGYKMSIWDMPHLIELMEKANIMLDINQSPLKYNDKDTVSL